MKHQFRFSLETKILSDLYHIYWNIYDAMHMCKIIEICDTVGLCEIYCVFQNNVLFTVKLCEFTTNQKEQTN